MTRSDNYGTVRADPRRRSFSMVPEDLINDKAVPHLGVRLWAKLDRIAAGRERAIGSRAKLAADLNVSPSTLDRARRALEDAGWLGVERVEGESSRYTTYDVKTYPQGVVIYGDTQMGVVTSDEGVSSPVTNGVSSRVTTEERATTREKREPPLTPRSAEGVRCAAGHNRPRRGCCTDRDRNRVATRAAADDRRSWPRWCGTCDGPETRRPFDAEGELVTTGQCTRCHPTAVRRQA